MLKLAADRADLSSWFGTTAAPPPAAASPEPALGWCFFPGARGAFGLRARCRPCPGWRWKLLRDEQLRNPAGGGLGSRPRVTLWALSLQQGGGVPTPDTAEKGSLSVINHK